MRPILALCLLVFASFATIAFAQGADEQPVRIIVPLAAGSTSDVIARLIAEEIHSATGRPVIVDNKPGAVGRIAVAALKHSPPDSTTLLMAPLAVPVLTPLTDRNIDYDPAKDFAPVTQVAEFAIAFAVGSQHPATTLPEFVAWARANPVDATFGSPGGGLPQLFGAMIGKDAGIDLIHVAYKSGTQVSAALMGGQVSSGMGALSDFLALHRAGKIRIIGTSGARRSALAPDIPTFTEQGFAAVVGTSWISVVAPAQTPKAVIDRWSKLIVAALQKPEFRAKLLRLGVEPTGTTPEALAAIISADTVRWAAIIKASGITLE
jgi:tripartite-type tricarboxylate transporter receptor subunit TctC